MTDKYEVEVLLRPPVELYSALVAVMIAGMAVMMPDRLMMTPSIAYVTASILGVVALVRCRQAWTVIRYQQRLKRIPRYRLSSSAIPVSDKGLFLGRGFRWTQRHTERLYAARDKNAEKYVQSGRLRRFVRQKEMQWGRSRFFKPIATLTARDTWWNPLRPKPGVGGESVLHGVGIDEERDVFMPLSERAGHTVVIARTRHGKTRLAEVLITQDIHREEA